MKSKIGLIICLTISSFTMHAQSSTKLDAKYGFNKFILGSYIDDIKKISKIRIVKSQDAEVIAYSVKNIEDYGLFEYNLSAIYLFFFRGQLLSIKVNLLDYDYTEKDKGDIVSKDIIHKIESEYGVFTERELSTHEKLNDITTSAQILGKDATLLLTSLKPITYNNRTTYKGLAFTFISNRVYALRESYLAGKSGL